MPSPPRKRPPLLVFLTQTRIQELSEDFCPPGVQQSVLVLQEAGDRAEPCLPTWFEQTGGGLWEWTAWDLP